MGDLIKQLSDALERIFRYMLPGVWLLIVAYLSHPSWFDCMHYDQRWQLALLAIIALCAGNVWYVFHRNSVHQLVDWIVYLRTHWRTHERWGYHKWLIDHVARSFRLREARPELRRPLEMRSAHIIFMFIVCETVFISAFWREQCSWFGKSECYRWLIAFAAFCFFLAAIWQYYILFNVDSQIATNPGPPSRGTPLRGEAEE